jgi:hypothetical protein
MTNIFITEQEFLNSYNKKKEQSEKRAIDFTFTLEEWKTFIRLKYRLTCAYTNQKFEHKGDHKFNPTIERINESGAYSPDNAVWVTKKINGLKNTYIELGKSQKGLGTNDIGLLHRVQKILNKSDGVEQIMKPYKESYGNLNKQLSETHEAKMKDLEEQRIKLEEEAVEKAAHDAKADKINQQRLLATHYLRISGQFQELGCTLDLTIKEFRDLTRKKFCSFSGYTFKDLSEKNFYVINVNKPLTKDNLKVCTKEVSTALTIITKCNPNVTSILSKGLAKL